MKAKENIDSQIPPCPDRAPSAPEGSLPTDSGAQNGSNEIDGPLIVEGQCGSSTEDIFCSIFNLVFGSDL